MFIITLPFFQCDMIWSHDIMIWHAHTCMADAERDVTIVSVGCPRSLFFSLHFLRRDSGHFAMTHWVPKWQRQTPALWTLLVPMPLHGANGFDYDEGTCCMYHQVGFRSLHTVILETKALKQKLAKITTCWPLKRCHCQDGLQFFQDFFWIGFRSLAWSHCRSCVISAFDTDLAAFDNARTVAGWFTWSTQWPPNRLQLKMLEGSWGFRYYCIYIYEHFVSSCI